MMEMVGLDPRDYPKTFFKTLGPLNADGLTVPAYSLGFGNAQIWDQDQSIMGWTCGFAMAAARDVAKFY